MLRAGDRDGFAERSSYCRLRSASSQYTLPAMAAPSSQENGVIALKAGTTASVIEISADGTSAASALRFTPRV